MRLVRLFDTDRISVLVDINDMKTERFMRFDVDLLVENSTKHLSYDILSSLWLLYAITREYALQYAIDTTRCTHERVSSLQSGI